MKIFSLITKSAFLLLLAIIVVSCLTQTRKDEIAIRGKIDGAVGKMVVLEELTATALIKMDSTLVSAESDFAFAAHPVETTFYLLRFEDEHFITVVLSPGEKLEITAEAGSFPENYEVTGNEDSKVLQQYFTETYRRQRAIDRLREEFFSSTHRDDFQKIKERIDRELAQVISDQRNFTISLIGSNPGSIAGLLLINQRFANQKMADAERDFDLYELLDSTLMKQYPSNGHVLEHHRRVADFRHRLEEERQIEEKLSPGQPIPDITLKDPSEKAMKLSDLRGKMVLLYFWVSWSPPCRAANHQLKELYAQNQPNNFEIFAISLDHEQRYWADAIKVDELPWINVSDLRGMTSPVAKVFNLPQELPLYYLIDEEGVILLKTTKFGEVVAFLKNS
ncbi:MAG: AhpC/TSA family protein [Bacteroidales bacterium]|nr:AhpC/TSA family protein [Bacteroidales bacterium]